MQLSPHSGHSGALRCFALNIDPDTVMPEWFVGWREQFLCAGSKLSDRHEEALGRLIPLLLCGEQSAIHVFGNEVERLRGSKWSDSIAALKQVETDEYAHEQALQTLSSSLMEPADLHWIKRAARHFYLSLGITGGMVEHFARVSQLDACVCIIMNAITHCDLGRHHLITQLFERIKKDEARHVSLCRDHYLQLGGDRCMFTQGRGAIGKKLVPLLATEAGSFESLGIDADRLFKKLAPV
jgi:hypothetical protein